MEICLDLLWSFFKIGLFTIGGGYAMIPLINQVVVAKGFLTEDALLNFIGISEATPGPFAINIATFVGASQYGFWGALSATIGVVLPSFIIILLIVSVFKQFAENRFVKGALKGIAPVVCALIISTGILTFTKTFVSNFGQTSQPPTFDFVTLAIFLVAIVVSLTYKKITKKSFSPVLTILLSAILGMVCYAIF